jgi:single-stranded-DNA-specific exonuclease
MISVSGKIWEEIYTNKRQVEKIKIEYGLSEIQSKIVLSKNYSREEIHLIKNKLDLSNPFYNNKDFLLGCELLHENIINKKRILVIGDYDVDGCMSAVLLVNFIRKNCGKVDYFIPDRLKDGYGASLNLIIRLIKQFDPGFIIFVDNGSNAHDALKFIKSKKIQSLIIDHHNTSPTYPEADVFINPKKNCEYNYYDYVCSTFLTYLFIDLYSKLKKNNLRIQDDLILVLLASVADVMPMKGINKILSKKVLFEFDINRNFLFKNILKFLNIKKKLEVYELGYKIAPLLNAAGRLGNANDIVELFTTTSKDRITSILQKIYKLNNKRKLIENEILNELKYDNYSKENGIIFIYKENLHEGLIGIIASRFKEYLNKPCIILTNSNNLIKGSARSTLEFNIGDLIQKSVQLGITLGGGGHNLAAGVSLKKNKLNTFKNFINKNYNSNNTQSKNLYTSKLSLNAINKEFIKSINLLGPFGNKNSQPVFLINDIRFIKQSLIKNQYISCFVKKGRKMIKSISFNNLNSKISYEILNSINNFDVLVKIKLNIWNYKSTMVLEIIDLIKKTNKS